MLLLLVLPPKPVPMVCLLVAGYNDVKDDPSMGWARYAHSMRVFVFNSGLFYIRPTQASIALLDTVAHRLATENGWDQAIFNEVRPPCLACPARLKHVKVQTRGMLPLSGRDQAIIKEVRPPCLACPNRRKLFKVQTRGILLLSGWDQAIFKEIRPQCLACADRFNHVMVQASGILLLSGWDQAIFKEVRPCALRALTGSSMSWSTPLGVSCSLAAYRVARSGPEIRSRLVRIQMPTVQAGAAPLSTAPAGSMPPASTASPGDVNCRQQHH